MHPRPPLEQIFINQLHCRFGLRKGILRFPKQLLPAGFFQYSLYLQLITPMEQKN
jgi:hypothetical protein